ncbi:unnamed protein product, partial [Mesorhabditis spiculigera]
MFGNQLDHDRLLYTWTSKLSYGTSLRARDLPNPLTLHETSEFKTLTHTWSNYSYAFTVTSEYYYKSRFLTVTVLKFKNGQLWLDIGEQNVLEPGKNSYVFDNTSTAVYCAAGVDDIWLTFLPFLHAHGKAMVRLEMWHEDPGIDCVPLVDTWTSSEAYGVSLIVADITPPITISELVQFTKLADKYLHYVYVLTVLSDAFFKVPPDLIAHVVLYHPPQSFTKIGAETIHTFVTPPRGNRVSFTEIRPLGGDTNEDDCVFYGYLGSIEDALDSKRFVDKFTCDGRTMIPELLWSYTIATLRFGKATFDITCTTKPFHFNYLLLRTTWIPSVVSARLRTRLEWHRQADPMRRCTEIIPRPSTTGVIMSTTPGVVRSSGIGANFRLVGIIVSSVLGTICLLVGLILLIRWRRKRLIEFEQGIARQIARLLEKHDPRWYLG